MTRRPFRFGVNCTTTSAREWLEAARRAEGLGYSTFIAQDHFANQLAPMPALAAAAGVTSTIRLATLVLDNDFRHPALLAKEAATLDLLSNGRFELGLGAGWLEADYAQTGISFDPPPTRIKRLRESVHIIKDLLSNETPVSYQGEHFQLKHLEPLPAPVQRPRLPLMLGGRQKTMLTLAAEEADIVSISLLGQAGATFEQKVAWVRQAAGPRLQDIELHVNISRVDVPSKHVEQAPNALTGSVEQVIETLLQRREAFGITYYVIKAAAMDDFAPVIARLP